MTVSDWDQPSPLIWSTWTSVHRVTHIETVCRAKMHVLRVQSHEIGLTWTFSPWKSSLKMLSGHYECHHIVDTCNTFPVCYRAKFESIHIRFIWDSSQSNHHHRGCNMNQLPCNKPNGAVSSKFTKASIVFSLRVSFNFIHFNAIQQEFENLLKSNLETCWSPLHKPYFTSIKMKALLCEK